MIKSDSQSNEGFPRKFMLIEPTETTLEHLDPDVDNDSTINDQLVSFAFQANHLDAVT
jgi:hypothetical protein